MCNSRSVEIDFLEISGPTYEEHVALQNLNPAPLLAWTECPALGTLNRRRFELS
jgi:hypothetical protein